MKRVFLIIMIVLSLSLISSCSETNSDQNNDANEVKAFYSGTFYKNAIDIKDLGLRLGERGREDYYQIMQLNVNSSDKYSNVLVFPAHYKGIPILGYGIAHSKYIFPGPKNLHDYCASMVPFTSEPDEYYLDRQEGFSENRKVDTFYVSTHHTGHFYTPLNSTFSEAISIENMKKIVYMCNIFRDQNLYIPFCTCSKTDFTYNHYSKLGHEIEDLLGSLPMGIFAHNYEFLKNLDFKFVVTKDYQEYIMEIFETKFKEYVPEKHQNDIQYLDTLNFRGFVYYFLLEKWFVEPNIYFYNNRFEEDEDIYWIDHNDNGETLFIPYEPYNDGKAFLGWYTEKECINEWNFDTKIELGENEVLNLYAKWE